MYVQRRHGWTYQKRPGVEYFLSHLFDFYEIVIFTSDIPMVGSTYYIPVCIFSGTSLIWTPTEEQCQVYSHFLTSSRPLHYPFSISRFHVLQFSCSLQTAQPLIAALDPNQYTMYHLYRSDTNYTNGHHIKVLCKLFKFQNTSHIVESDYCSLQCALVYVASYTFQLQNYIL